MYVFDHYSSNIIRPEIIYAVNEILDAEMSAQVFDRVEIKTTDVVKASTFFGFVFMRQDGGDASVASQASVGHVLNVSDGVPYTNVIIFFVVAFLIVSLLVGIN